LNIINGLNKMILHTKPNMVAKNLTRFGIGYLSRHHCDGEIRLERRTKLQIYKNEKNEKNLT
jgi:hypothetical protein